MFREKKYKVGWQKRKSAEWRWLVRKAINQLQEEGRYMTGQNHGWSDEIGRGNTKADREEKRREAVRAGIAAKSAHWQAENELDKKVAGNITSAMLRSLARERRFPNGVPAWATFVVKCLTCGKDVLFHSGVPQAAKGELSQLKCKSCGKSVPFGDNSKRSYDPRAVRHLDEEVDDMMKKIAAEKGIEKFELSSKENS